MSTPKRYSAGVTNVASSDLMGQLIIPDLTSVYMYFNDFYRYSAPHWTITTTEDGAGSATEAIQDEKYGVLKLTNAAADNDLDFLQLAKESFAMESGKKAWFKARCKVSDKTESDFLIGLVDRDTTPLDASDGIWFQKDDDAATLDFRVAKADDTSIASAIATIVDDTYMVMGFYYNGKSTIEYWIDNEKKGTLAVDTMPTTELCPTFGIMNGEAVAKTMSIDYIMAITER